MKRKQQPFPYPFEFSQKALQNLEETVFLLPVICLLLVEAYFQILQLLPFTKLDILFKSLKPVTVTAKLSLSYSKCVSKSFNKRMQIMCLDVCRETNSACWCFDCYLQETLYISIRRRQCRVFGASCNVRSRTLDIW